MNQIAINLIVGTSLLLSFLVFLNPNGHNKIGNKWMGAFIFCLFLINIDEFLIINDFLFFKNKGILLMAFPLFVAGPFFYFSIIYFVNPTLKWKNKNYWHFIFGLLFLVFSYNQVFLENEKIIIKNDDGSIHEWINKILIFGILPFQAVFYVSQSYFEIQKHKKNIKQFSSNTNDIDLQWLEKILYFIGVLGILLIIDIATHAIDFLNFALLICIFYIGFYTIKQKEIFPFLKHKKEEINEIFEANINNEIEKKQLLSSEKLIEIKSNLIERMQTQKPFLNPDLSLIVLANQMEISAHNLSFVINEGFDENFNQFINRYRIEEAKKMIVDPKMNHFSISGIGFEVGFNSKSVFNSTFKKITNVTPLQFKIEYSSKKISSEL